MTIDDDAEAVYHAMKAQAALAEQGLHAEPPSATVSYLPNPASHGAGDITPVRDFKSAIDLIKEASEAIRFAEERSAELEQQLHQVSGRAAEQVKALEIQVAALERRLMKSEERARAAEVRANDAETWLSRLHDTIITSFRRPVMGTDGDA
ncbi:hypothetical protein [Methylobacterium aerolatum]|uniref:Uncharacterized protein n=1 Tax=Methylobacterium aerolatum TaxID=418708 RepID=A0ABU0HY22_9HYPH|nr:hypothetical protein [Methylobacterium aerolatum]MDQ0447234.1 hypothetical protein [Methylobacterium aerolatum]GJD36902.1 hypothetical protein FMGBMHLM_3826 [Methylobacterium aerolatum]